jgi:PEGA domain
MKRSWLLLLSLVLFTACATITRGVHEKLSVVSDPPGATVLLSTGERGVTPVKFVKTRRGESFTVRISKPGYVALTVKVQSKGGPTGGTAMAANAVSGGIIGVAVDASTGAYNSLYPNPISVHLTAEPTVAKSKRTSSAASESKRPPKSKPIRTAPRIETSPTPESSPVPQNSPTPEPSATPEKPVLESSPVLQSSPTP